MEHLDPYAPTPKDATAADAREAISLAEAWITEEAISKRRARSARLAVSDARRYLRFRDYPTAIDSAKVAVVLSTLPPA